MGTSTIKVKIVGEKLEKKKDERVGILKSHLIVSRECISSIKQNALYLIKENSENKRIGKNIKRERFDESPLTLREKVLDGIQEKEKIFMFENS